MSFLSALLDSTRRRVAEAQSKVTEEVLEQRVAAAEPARGFAASLQGPGTALIAEIKRATPSQGLLRADLDPRKLAGAYASGGAQALSVLTEPTEFQGRDEDLVAARETGLPVLRKDFTLSQWQILESRALGADAVLLIVRILGAELSELLRASEALGMGALVEVYTADDLTRALDAGASLIGVNHRDLDTFEVDPDRTAKLAPSVPDGVTLVSLSGVHERADVEALAEAGARAVLVGEALIRADDPAAKVRELRGS